MKLNFKDLNKSQLAQCLGRDAKIINDWLAKGCPHDKLGTVYIFNLPDVIKWRENDIRGFSKKTTKIDEDLLAATFDKEKEAARLTHEQADKVAMENSVRRGELVDMSEIEDWWCGQLVNMKNRIMSLPSKLIPQIIGETDKAKANETAKQMCIEALNELSGNFKRSGEEVISGDM